MTLFDGLNFGWRTALLSVALAQLLLIAAALLRPIANRSANRTLAALLLVLAGICTPWMIGFAGFYDKWRWLTFLPVQITLAVAPLVWLYVRALVFGRWPERAWRHLLLPLGQFAFLFGSFLLPLPIKNRWAELVGGPIDVIVTISTLIGLAVYGVASLQLLRRYRQWLATQRADDDRFASQWLQRVLIITLLLAALWSGYGFWNLVSPLGYTGFMGLYVAIAAIALYLGIEGWRHAHLPFPPMPVLDVETVNDSGRDWRTSGTQWAAIVKTQRWHADPELSLPVLARRLGTNSNYLSRALNEGLGVNFSQFVNALRSEAVAAMIDEGRDDDLLDLALEAGFSSKASFNRAFLNATGRTPSAYRTNVRQQRRVSKDE